MFISKRIIAGIISALLIISLITGCTTGKKTNTGDKINVVCTIFPEYDWVRSIVGENADNVEIKMLLGNGTDLHSYQPTADDMISISESDLFIYVGGESDKWVADALKDVNNESMRVINLLDVMGSSVKEEETIEGMQEEEHEHDENEDEPEYDEHVWLSLKNAILFCEKITEQLSVIDAENAETYKLNLKAYTEKLDELDKQYQQAADNSEQKTLLFGDRFPFRYLTDDYGISYYAAFAGCSAETEASFETVAFLAKKVDELGLGSVITIEGTTHKIAETIIKNTKTKDQTVVSLNSMQSVTDKDVKNGATYLDIMKLNLEVIKKVLA